MKTARLVIGIISMVLAGLIMFQSCAAGVVEVIDESMGGSGGTSGTAGVYVAVLYLAAGIVGVACRKNKPGSIVAGAIYWIGFLVGSMNNGIFADLMVWAFISLAFGVFFIAGGILQQNPAKAKKKIEDD